MHDIFEPRREPERSLYVAFQEEATKRKGRSVDEWTRAELDRVHQEACIQAQRHGLRAPSLEEIAHAEISARGHVDYGSKWALRVCELMRGSPPSKRIAG